MNHRMNQDGKDLWDHRVQPMASHLQEWLQVSLEEEEGLQGQPKLLPFRVLGQPEVPEGKPKSLGG